MISGERSIWRSVCWMASLTRPISRLKAESLRLAVSMTVPRLSRQPSIAAVTPENSPTPLRRPPSRGNCWPESESQRSRLPMARRVSTVSARASASRTPPILAAPDVMANVVQASEGGPQPCGQGFGHFGSQSLAIVDLTRVEAGLQPERGGFAERTGRAGRHQGANLIKVEKLERVRVHVASTRESKQEFAEATSIIARSVLSEPSRLRAYLSLARGLSWRRLSSGMRRRSCRWCWSSGLWRVAAGARVSNRRGRCRSLSG